MDCAGPLGRNSRSAEQQSSKAGGGWPRGVPCAARSNSSQVSRRSRHESVRESGLVLSVIVCTALAVGFGFPVLTQGCESSKQQSSQLKSDRTNTGRPGAGASDRAPSANQTPRNPRVSALRVLPEGILLSEGTKASRHEASRGGGATSAAMRLLVPSAFRPARVT